MLPIEFVVFPKFESGEIHAQLRWLTEQRWQRCWLFVCEIRTGARDEQQHKLGFLANLSFSFKKEKI